MNSIPNNSPKMSRWLMFGIAAIITVMILFVLPPPFPALLLIAWATIGILAGLNQIFQLNARIRDWVAGLYDTGESPATPLAVFALLLKEIFKRTVTPLLMVLRAFVRVNLWWRHSTATQEMEGEWAVSQATITRKRLALELLAIVLMVGLTTSRFYTAGSDLQLSGDETEWLTSSAYAAHKGLRQYGRIPLWQPLLEFGEPLLDNPFSFVLNPISAGPSVIVGGVAGLKMSVVLTTLIAGLGGWVLGWTLGLGTLGRVMLALLLVGKGNMHAMFNTGYYQLAASQAYFPWIIAGAVGIFRRPDQRWPVAMLALGATLLWFAGNVWYTLPMAICVLVIAVVYLIRPVRFPRSAAEQDTISTDRIKQVREWGKRVIDWRGFRRLLLAGALTIGLSAVTLLPLWSNQGQLSRHPPEWEAGWVSPLWEYVIPFYFNPDPQQQVGFFDPVRQVWQDWWHIDELAEFYYSFVTPFWFIVLIFVLMPLYRSRWNKMGWIAWALLIFFTLWGAGGNALFVWLYQQFIPLREWRFVGRALAVSSFWLAALVAMRVDSLWRIIRTASWGEMGIGAVMARSLPRILCGILILGSSLAAYQVNQQWQTSNNNIINPIHADDECVSWLRAQYPDAELTIWRGSYHGVTTLVNNRVRVYRVQADFEMSPVRSTIGRMDLTTSFPEFAVLAYDDEREFMGIQGYEVVEDSPLLPNTSHHCLYRKADALSFMFTVPVDTLVAIPPPLTTNIYRQPYVPLPPEVTTPITTYLRQPDNILVVADGTLMEETVLTIQERAFPGWRVEIDGRPAQLESVGGQIGVRLPRDRQQHTIYFEYRPALLILGGWITLATAGFYGIYLLKPSRKWLARVYASDASRTVLFAVISLGLMIASALLFRAGNSRQLAVLAAGLMLAGGLALGVALLTGRRSSEAVLPLPAPSAIPSTPVRMNRTFIGLSIVILALLVSINIAPDETPLLGHVSHHIQFVMFAGGVALLAAGLCGLRLKRTHVLAPHQGAAPETHRTLNWRREGAILLAVLVFASLPRFITLGETTRFEVDELQAVVGVNTLENTPDVNILGTVKHLHWDWSWIFPYMQTWLVKLVGHNWTGLRLIGALSGLAAIAAIYLLARAWFDRWTALLAAVLLAALPAHIHFSRISIINIADPVFGVLALAALSWGMRTGRRFYFVVGGLLLGLTQYFYEGGRLLFPPLTVAWLVGVAVLWPGRISWWQVRLALVTAIVVAAPFYMVMIGTGRPFAERMGDNFIGWEFLFSSAAIFIPHIVQPFLAFVNDPDWVFAYTYYGGNQPILLPYMVVCFLLGLGFMVWRLRYPGMLLLVGWLVLVTLGNFVIRDNGMVARYVVIFPGLALLAAIGIRHTLALIWPHRLPLQAMVAAVLVIAMCFGQIYYYFAIHLPQYEIDFRIRRPGRDLDDAMQRAKALPTDTEIYIVTDLFTDNGKVDLYYINQVRWMSDFMLDRDDVHILSTQDVSLQYFFNMSQMTSKAFFLVPDDHATLDMIRVVFRQVSEGIPSPYADIPAAEQFILYHIAGMNHS